MNLIDKDALIESLGIETDCYDCEHETIIYHCDLDPVTVCEKIIQAPVITVTTESAEKPIEVLKNAAWLGAVYSFEETEEAVKTAIRALQVTSAQYNVHDFPKDADCISRQQAIDALIEWYGCEPTDIGAFENIIEKMPSAQPDPCVDTIDTLNERIKHFDDMAEECRRNANIERNDYMDLRDDAAEYRQLYLWLNELKWFRERFQLQPERTCRGCKHEPRCSHEEPCGSCSNNYVNKWERRTDE